MDAERKLPDGRTVARAGDGRGEYLTPADAHGGLCGGRHPGGLAPGRLELEITESVVLDNDPAILRHLHQLREMGVRISLDDFGTGYASLAYLRRLPLDKIKIDQSFIRGLPDAPDAMAIVRAVARLAGDLGMVTTAEGVETEAQLDVLAQLGCTQAQGFLIGHADADPVRHLRAQGPRQAGGING